MNNVCPCLKVYLNKRLVLKTVCLEEVFIDFITPNHILRYMCTFVTIPDDEEEL